jgi:hypothetical protein
MKTRSSSTPATTLARESVPPPKRSRRAASPADASEACSTRLEVIPPAQLRVLDRPARASTPALQTVHFGYFGPDASEVFVVGSFNEWNPRATPMERDALGDWTVEIQLPRGEHRYRFLVDGDWRDDPNATQTVVNPFGGFDSIVVVV